MITIVAKSVVKKDKVDEFINIAKELIEESRKEEGCISYKLNQDINDKNILTFIEQWKDEEAIKIHNNTNHFKSIVPKFEELKEEEMINLYKEV